MSHTDPIKAQLSQYFALPATTNVCQDCGVPAVGFSRCDPCNTRQQTGLPRADSIKMLAWAIRGTQGYRDMFAYKNDPPDRGALARVKRRFQQSLTDHTACIIPRTLPPIFFSWVPSTQPTVPTTEHPLRQILPSTFGKPKLTVADSVGRRNQKPTATRRFPPEPC